MPSLARLARRPPRRVLLLALILTLGLYTLAQIKQRTAVPVKLARPLLTARVNAAFANAPVANAHGRANSHARQSSWWSKTHPDWGQIAPAARLEPRSDGTVVVRRRQRSRRQVGAASEHEHDEAEEEEGHPIRRLMAEARDEWEAMLARQSKTFEDAVAAYRARYGRSPPRGFEAWWAFARANDIRTVDDYDEIARTIEPFLALPLATLHARLAQLLDSNSFGFGLSVRRSSPVSLTGDRSSADRPKLLAALVEGFRHALPEDFGEGEGPVRLAGSDHDLGGNVMGEAFRERMVALARAGKEIGNAELSSFEDRSGLGSRDRTSSACKTAVTRAESLKSAYDIVLEPIDLASEQRRTKPVTFLRDVETSYNFCHNPTILSSHGALSFDFMRDPTLRPELVLSKYAQGNQILMTPLEGFSNETHRTPWAQKSVHKVFWRGSSTGDAYSSRQDYDWHDSHRIRLHALTARTRKGRADVLVEARSKRGGPTLALQRYELSDLNRHLMDVGLSDVIQCNEADGTCAAMRTELPLAPRVDPRDALHYKVVLDIDGNAWSARFRRLLSSGSVVFKSTIFPEFNSQWLKPWLHYVPVSIDLTPDLYTLATFYLGTPDGGEGHDDLAREIADAAADFVDKHWRWVDMQAYMFRLLLEYRRLLATDRDAMSSDGHFQ